MTARTAPSEDLINEAYLRSGNTLGWRLLTSPVATMHNAEVAFIGLNPGGNTDRPDHPRYAMPSGSAYVEENWTRAPAGRSPLQRQIRALFQKLGQRPENVLSGNFVPFRSPTWAALNKKEEALHLGKHIWRQLIDMASPRLIIGMGKEVSRHLEHLLEVSKIERLPVGWGNVTGSRAAFDGGVLVGLPHLSRFPIIERPQSQENLEQLFGPDWNA